MAPRGSQYASDVRALDGDVLDEIPDPQFVPEPLAGFDDTLVNATRPSLDRMRMSRWGNGTAM